MATASKQMPGLKRTEGTKVSNVDIEGEGYNTDGNEYNSNLMRRIAQDKQQRKRRMRDRSAAISARLE